ncbi:MAG: pilus assembly protein [Alphaproteobacteria bacterium]|nr:pilus assembly protein [Alphaproteobacteria bacterium]
MRTLRIPRGADDRATRSATARLRRRRGNIATVAAITVVPLIAAVGFGVDYTRISLVRSELQRGVDAAALAGARVINADGTNTDEISGDALMYFWANYRKSVADATIVGDNPSVALLQPNKDTVKVDAYATIPLAFGRFLGKSTASTHATASASRAVGGMEVVLVLDNTGSMSRGTRMSDLKEGAKDLIEILYGSTSTDTKSLSHCPNGNNGSCTTEYTLTVGLVPFITTVNISPGRANGGNGKSNIMDAAAVARQDWGRSNGWKGCVFARPYPFEESRADATPTASPFSPYIWKATNGRGANSWSNSTVESWPTDAAEAGQSAINRQTVGAGSGRENGPNMGCGQPLMPLQPSQAAAVAQIDNLEVGASNGTAVPVGLAWGWRLLSPDWRPWWENSSTKLFLKKKPVTVTTPAGVPRDYKAKNYEKVIVLFSDGQNELGASRSNDDCCVSGYGDPVTVYNTLGADPVPELNRRTSEICTAIKAKGIKIYVVLLYPNPPQSLVNLYNENGCASGKNYYFLASSESQLQTIFRTVGSQLKNLRLVQ